MADKWIYAPDVQDSVDGVVNVFNQAFPSADVAGAAYRHPSVNRGALIVLIGQQHIDPSMGLYLVGAKGKLHREGLYTYCANNEKGDKQASACVVEASPSVLLYYTEAGTDAGAFNLTELAKMAAELQAEL